MTPQKMKLLCKLGIHRPLTKHKHSFIDRVSGRSVYIAECACGKEWMVDSVFPMFGFKVELNNSKPIKE